MSPLPSASATDGARCSVCCVLECLRRDGARGARAKKFFAFSLLRRSADFQPPVTPLQQIFAPLYENLFCPDSVRVYIKAATASQLPTARPARARDGVVIAHQETRRPNQRHKRGALLPSLAWVTQSRARFISLGAHHQRLADVVAERPHGIGAAQLFHKEVGLKVRDLLARGNALPNAAKGDCQQRGQGREEASRSSAMCVA